MATTKVKVKRKSKQLPAWEVMMQVGRSHKRPRFFSLHTIAAMTGQDNLIKLAREMKKSKKVITCYCPVVEAPVFYLEKYRYSYGSYPETWKRVKGFVKKYPYPAVKGFKAAAGHWSGSYGVGKYIPGDHTMNKPFIAADRIYARNILKALKKAGYKPTIKASELC